MSPTCITGVPINIGVGHSCDVFLAAFYCYASWQLQFSGASMAAESQVRATSVKKPDPHRCIFSHRMTTPTAKYSHQNLPHPKNKKRIKKHERQTHFQWVQPCYL